MASLIIDTEKILENIIKLDDYLARHNINWTLATKMLCGYQAVLEKLITSDVIKRTHSVADSRVSNLRIIKEIRQDVVTMYIKPPPMDQVGNVVRYADISMNTTLQTIEALNKEAARQDKIHRIIVMIEMGELREGVIRDNVLSFYEKVFELPHIEVIGIGTNLGCMYGVEPTYDKLIQLCLYEQLIEAKFDRNLELVSGGSSITLPLISKKKVPLGVNHFRIGETVFLGTDLNLNKKFRNLSTATFDFIAEIVELAKKETAPDGIVSEANIGHTSALSNEYRESYRCILDFGILDVDVNDLVPKDDQVSFFGTTSDMTVYDLGKRSGKYKVGSQVHFWPNYMAVARLMNSRYVEKVIK